MREFRLFSARKIYPGEDERWSQEQVWPGPGRPAEEEDRTAPEDEYAFVERIIQDKLNCPGSIGVPLHDRDQA